MGKIITETPIDEFISRFRHNAEHQRKIGDLHGCLEFRQLADTLEKYQKIEQIFNEDFEAYHPLDRNSYRLSLIREVLEDGKV